MQVALAWLFVEECDRAADTERESKRGRERDRAMGWKRRYEDILLSTLLLDILGYLDAKRLLHDWY